MKRVLIFTLLISSLSLWGSELEKDEWSVLFGELEEIELSFSNRLLTSSIPNYLLTNIPDDVKHSMTEDERTLIEEELRQVRLKELIEDKVKLLDKRDELLFDNGTDKNREKYSGEIEELDEEIDGVVNWKLKSSDPITVKVLPESEDDLEYLDDFTLSYYLKQEGLDYYVGGSIAEEYDNLFVNLFIYSVYSGEKTTFWSGLGSTEEILNARQDMLLALYNVILSDSVVTYNVECSISDALIYVDDQFVGLGSYNGITTIGTELNIEIEREGFLSFSTNTIIDEAEKHIEVELIERDVRTIRLDSDPKGAKVYYGASYLGVTPLLVPVTSNAQKLSLFLDGYLNQSYIIDDSSEDFTVTLIEGLFDADRELEVQRGKFYTSAAIFSISLGVPLFLSTQESAQGTTFLNISMGNSVVWGVNLFYRLYRYLQAAEASVE